MRRKVLNQPDIDELYLRIYETDVPINLKTRTYHILKRNNINTISQLKGILPKIINGDMKIQKLGNGGIQLLKRVIA